MILFYFSNMSEIKLMNVIWRWNKVIYFTGLKYFYPFLRQIHETGNCMAVILFMIWLQPWNMPRLLFHQAPGELVNTAASHDFTLEKFCFRAWYIP